MARTNQPKPIPLIYRVFFTIIEPLCVLNAAYIYATTPTKMLQISTPQSMHGESNARADGDRDDAPPTSRLVICPVRLNPCPVALHATARGRARVAGGYTVLGTIIIGDIGHLWAMKGIAEASGSPGGWYNPLLWTRWEDWSHQGMTWFAMGLRIAFVLGVGL